MLWSRFKEGIDKLQQEPSPSRRPTSSMARRRSSAQKATGAIHGNGAIDDPSASVRINDFVPAQSVPARMTSPTSARQVTSALSASIATSSFHYPGDRRSVTRNEGASRSRPSSPAPSSPGRSSTTRVVSPSTASSRTVTMAAFDAEASIRDAHRRNMDESKDIATSYRYVLDLEAQMAEHQRASSSTQDAGPSSAGTVDIVSPAAVPRGRSPRGTKSSIKKGKEKENARPVTPTKEQESEAAEKAGAPAKETTPKGKRKVTFDVKPEIAIIDNETAGNETEKDTTEEGGRCLGPRGSSLLTLRRVQLPSLKWRAKTIPNRRACPQVPLRSPTASQLHRLQRKSRRLLVADAHVYKTPMAFLRPYHRCDPPPYQTSRTCEHPSRAGLSLIGHVPKRRIHRRRPREHVAMVTRRRTSLLYRLIRERRKS